MRTPALFALLFFVAGILTASYTDLSALIYLAIGALFAAAAIVLFLAQRHMPARIALWVAIAATGGFLTELQTTQIPSNHISHFTSLNRTTTLTGVVVSEPDIRPTKTFLAIALDSIEIGNKRIGVTGRIRLQIQEPTALFNYRDRVQFAGYVNKPQPGRNPGGFDYRKYLAIRQISAVVYVHSSEEITSIRSGAGDPFIRNVVAPIRDYIADVFEDHLSPDQGALIKGFLIGDVRLIPPEIYKRFKDTGTLHVLAASGANVGYVIATLMPLLLMFRLPRRTRFLLTILGVVIFSFIAYNQPSVVRASVMAVVALTGLAIYRDTNWLNTISFAALIILAFRPLYLYDIGFQLSFSAAFALILFMPWFDRILADRKNIFKKTTRYFLLILVGTLVAQLGVTPILLYHFHTVPLVSFLANVIVVPLVGVACTLSIVLVIVSAIPGISDLIGLLLGATLQQTLNSINYFHTVNIPDVKTAAPQLLVVVVYYLGVYALFSVIARKKIARVVLVLGLICLNVAIWGELLRDRAPKLEVTFLDTFDTSTTYLQQPSGSSTLINGGGTSASINQGTMTVVPFLRSKGIDHLDLLLAAGDSSVSVALLSLVRSEIEEGDQVSSKKSDNAIFRHAEITPSEPVISFSGGGIEIVQIFSGSTVQSLSRVSNETDILALDWTTVELTDFAAILQGSGVKTVIVSNYPNRYSDTKRLEELRRQFPNVQFYSTLESGALALQIGTDGYTVLPASHN